MDLLPTKIVKSRAGKRKQLFYFCRLPKTPKEQFCWICLYSNPKDLKRAFIPYSSKYYCGGVERHLGEVHSFPRESRVPELKCNWPQIGIHSLLMDLRSKVHIRSSTQVHRKPICIVSITFKILLSAKVKLSYFWYQFIRSDLQNWASLRRNPSMITPWSWPKIDSFLLLRRRRK